MDAAQLTYQIVAALIRRGDEVLLVRQQGPDDPARSWALPGGIVETGELLTEALAREMREETGLEVLDPGRLLYVVQSDNPNNEQFYKGVGSGAGYQATTFVFEISRWAGDLAIADPDGLILEARFLPLTDAIGKLEEEVPIREMGEPMVAYLRAEVGHGAIWFYRRQPDGSDQLIARLSG